MKKLVVAAMFATVSVLTAAGTAWAGPRPAPEVPPQAAQSHVCDKIDPKAPFCMTR
jgi:hypothetical protein